MKQKDMNELSKLIRKKYINKNNICLEKTFLIFYETIDFTNPTFIFIEKNKKHYPVNHFMLLQKKLQNLTYIKGIVFNDLKKLFDILTIFIRETSLNFIEKILISRLINNNQLVKYFPNLNFEYYLKFEKILSLPDEALNQIAEETIPPDLAYNLLSLSNNELHFFLKLVNKFKLTQSQQREVYHAIKDLSISSFPLTNEIKDRDMLMKKIREVTMPEFTKTFELFQKLKKSLELPKKVNLLETPFFESKNMKIEIFFKNYEELKERLNLLLKNIEKKEKVWEDIFKLI
jgi:hypothetical protein